MPCTPEPKPVKMSVPVGVLPLVIRSGKLGVLLALTLCVAFVCARIEILNAAAGGLLPRREYRNSDPSQGLVKWRWCPWTTEERWRLMIGPRDEEGRPVQRALTQEEEEQMRKDVRRAKANNALREFVGTSGLAQYILAPLLIILSIRAILSGQRKLRLLAWPTMGIGLAAVSLMFYRGYLTSVM